MLTRQRRLYGWSGAALIAAASLLAACSALYNDIVLDNKDHGLSCQQLPSAASVEQAVAVHADAVEQILAVSPGHVFLDVDRETCPGRADIVISFATHGEREAIESILNDGAFFDVPVRLRNQ